MDGMAVFRCGSVKPQEEGAGEAQSIRTKQAIGETDGLTFVSKQRGDAHDEQSDQAARPQQIHGAPREASSSGITAPAAPVRRGWGWGRRPARPHPSGAHSPVRSSYRTARRPSSRSAEGSSSRRPSSRSAEGSSSGRSTPGPSGWPSPGSARRSAARPSWSRHIHPSLSRENSVRILIGASQVQVLS